MMNLEQISSGSDFQTDMDVEQSIPEEKETNTGDTESGSSKKRIAQWDLKTTAADLDDPSVEVALNVPEMFGADFVPYGRPETRRHHWSPYKSEKKVHFDRESGQRLGTDYGNAQKPYDRPDSNLRKKLNKIPREKDGIRRQDAEDVGALLKRMKLEGGTDGQ